MYQYVFGNWFVRMRPEAFIVFDKEPSRTTGTGKRMKWSQSHKTGKICPAGMTTTNIDGT